MTTKSTKLEEEEGEERRMLDLGTVSGQREPAAMTTLPASPARKAFVLLTMRVRSHECVFRDEKRFEWQIERFSDFSMYKWYNFIEIMLS